MKKKMNDKGFSLVELIIVVAIMAVLIALLAPQYLKFVERSKKSADRDTVDQIIRTVQTDYADPETDYSVNGAKIVISTSAVAPGGATITEGTGTNLRQVLTNAGLDAADIKLKSSQWKDGTGASANTVSTITITFSYANETVQATVTDAYDTSGTSITGKNANTPTPTATP